MLWIRARGRSPASRRSPAKAKTTQNPLDSPLADATALVAQRCVNSRAPVGSSALRVQNADALAELFVGSDAGAPSPTLERVVALPRHPEQTTQDRDFEKRLLRADECELHSLSFAKKAAAFFRISRSVLSDSTSLRSDWFSRLSRASSASPLSA